MKKITLLSTEEIKETMEEDLILRQQLTKVGYAVKIKPWEKLADEGEDLFIIRTTWNYTQRYDEFIQCLENIQDRLWNPLPLIQWNSDKKYLLELYNLGEKVIPLTLAHDDSSLMAAMDKLGGNEFIVKPIMGASAKGLVRFNRTNLPALKQEMIVQKFYPEITEGEVSMIYFQNQFAFASRKIPRKGDIRVQEEYGSSIVKYEPTQADFSLAESVLKRIPTEWLYARVDLLPGHGLMELECIEPSLYLNHHEEGGLKYAQAIHNLLQ